MSVLLAMSAGASAAFKPENVTWSRLEFQATKFFLTARSEIELSGQPSREAIAELLDPVPLAALHSGQGDAVVGLAPRAARSYRIDIRTRILNRDSRVRFWFDPDDARALQRSSHDVSKKRLRHRTYRYTRGGVFSHTRRPGEGEEGRPHASWSRVDDKYVAFPSRASTVTEPAGLLYLVPAGNFHAAGDKDRIRVFSRGRVREVDVAVVGTERIGVDYIKVSGGGEQTVDGNREALRIAIRPRPGLREDSSDFKLLGLEGDIDMFIDPRSRVPLLVSGKVQVAGTVRLRLRRAVMR